MFLSTRQGLTFKRPVRLVAALNALFCIACLAALRDRARGAVRAEDWGSAGPANRVQLFTLTNGNLRVRITEYGARIVSLEAPDRQGTKADVVLGYNNLAQYVADPKDYFGAVVGRYANRIAGGSFAIDGTTYHVPVNSKGQALHGGPEGFSSKVWRGKIVGKNSVELTLVSPDGDMGFPGQVTVKVLYTLRAHQLRIDYDASTTGTTVINLTNHTYFNLAGQASGNVLGQEILLSADHFTPIDARLIPTGEIASVQATPFDFRHLTPIGKRIQDNVEQLKLAGGFDHNFVVHGNIGALRRAAYAIDPKSGRTLTVLTTEPGVQFYSGNFLSGAAKGYTGVPYQQHAGFCLETQHFPDSPHHPNFPSTILRPGTHWRSATIFAFGVSGSAG